MHAGNQPHSQYTFGNWAFYAPPDLATLNGATVQNQINTALAKDYVRGLSLRCQWNDLEPTRNNYSMAIPNRGLQMAQNYGKDFTLRITAGQQCPTYLWGAPDNCRNFTLTGDATPTPHACNTDGTPNTAWLNRYNALQTVLNAWCVANNVAILHHSWFGHDYSEIFGYDSGVAGSVNMYGPTVPGYNTGAVGDNWRAAHIAQWQQIWQNKPAGLAIEIPFSGLFDQMGGFGSVQTRIQNDSGPNSTDFFQNGNVLPVYQAFSNNFTHGAQTLRPGDGSARYWNSVYGGDGNVNGVEHSVRSHGVEYMEVFTTTYTMRDVVGDIGIASPTVPNNSYWIGDAGTTCFLGSHEPDLAACARAFLLRGGRKPKLAMGLS
jgi:hypothetical protein